MASLVKEVPVRTSIWAGECPRCHRRISNPVKVVAERNMANHLEWHAKVDGQKKEHKEHMQTARELARGVKT